MPAQNPAQALAALRAQAEALTLAIDTLAASLAAPGDELLGVRECRALRVGRDALLAAAKRGEVQLSRGPRQRLQVRRSELEKWLQSRPYVAPAASEPVQSLEDWQRSVLRKVGK
ncbi:MAG: hypothetical protein WDO69_05565 [Pseudomonadota bacterium]